MSGGWDARDERQHGSEEQTGGREIDGTVGTRDGRETHPEWSRCRRDGSRNGMGEKTADTMVECVNGMAKSQMELLRHGMVKRDRRDC